MNQINPEEAPDGYHAAAPLPEVHHETGLGSCTGCAFAGAETCESVRCMPCDRLDGQDVIMRRIT